MNYRFFLVVLLVSCCCIGCSRQSPLAEGKPLSGLIWEFPRSNPMNNSGSPIDKESHVSVYPTLIVILAPDGSRQIVPLEQVSDLKLK